MANKEPRKRSAPKVAPAEVNEDQTPDNSRFRREQPPIDKWSAEQVSPFSGGANTIGFVADDYAPLEERTGSVAPYFTDQIDVDSVDFRTGAQIQAEREAAEGNTDAKEDLDAQKEELLADAEANKQQTQQEADAAAKKDAK